MDQRFKHKIWYHKTLRNKEKLHKTGFGNNFFGYTKGTINKIKKWTSRTTSNFKAFILQKKHLTKWRKWNLYVLCDDDPAQLLWRTVCRFLKKLKMELSYNPAILLLSIYIQRKWNSVSDRYVHSQVYCSIVHNSQVMGKPKYPSRNDRIKILNTHTHIYIHIRWNITQLWERRKSCKLWQHGWTLC